MQGPFPYGKRYKYPHLSEGEAEIWERFVIKFPDWFDEVWYDVEVGTCRDATETLDEFFKSHKEYLNMRKIDALGKKDNQYTIVEVKKHAWHSALGEIQGYFHCFLKDWPTERPVKTMILTDLEMPDMREICKLDDTELMIV